MSMRKCREHVIETFVINELLPYYCFNVVLLYNSNINTNECCCDLKFTFLVEGINNQTSNNAWWNPGNIFYVWWMNNVACRRRQQQDVQVVYTRLLIPSHDGAVFSSPENCFDSTTAAGRIIIIPRRRRSNLFVLFVQQQFQVKIPTVLYTGRDDGVFKICYSGV